MRGVYKPPKSSFYWIRYAGVDGKIIRESSRSTRKSDAGKLFMERKIEVADGKNPHKRPIQDVTLAEFAPEYLKIKESSQRSYYGTVRAVNQLIEDFGNRPLKKYDYALVQDWITARLARNKYATVYRYYAVLKNILRTAVKRRKMPNDALDSVLEVKMHKPKNERLRYLSKAECERLISECHGQLKAIVITALQTGMRRGEILSLKWQNVDLDNNLIKLDASMTKDSEVRTIPMTRLLRETLRGIERRPHIEYVFWNSATKTRITDIKTSYNAALKRTKILDFTFHDLRHTFASQYMIANGNISELQALLGHESTRMTERYVQLSNQHIKSGMERFEKRMSVSDEVEMKMTEKREVI
jgi:integrase